MPAGITDAIVPVAGLGTRLAPATRAIPKEMLAIVDRPVIQYVVEELAGAGIERALLVSSPRKRAIADHFAVAAPLRLLCVDQDPPAGLGDAVARGWGALRGTPSTSAVSDGDRSSEGVVVALGDAILRPPADGGPGIVARLIEAHLAHAADATIAVAEVAAADVDRYGIVTGTPIEASAGAALRVSAIVEKPAPGTTDSRLAVAARYVIGPRVAAALVDTTPDAGGEIQLTDALSAVVAAGGRVLAVALAGDERREDIGSVRGYCETFLDHALDHPELGPALRARAAARLAES